MEITFSINQQKYTIKPCQVPIETSLLVFIRSNARLTGTKFMCLEGGCGACIVNISGIKTPSGESRTMAVNSCLWPVYACKDLNITTIEGIGSLKNGYHPIQKALYIYNGTQCGYCSPGMVMNMYSLLESNDGKLTMQQVENSFGGSICRCTGYRPILDAFKSFAMNNTAVCIGDIEDLTLDGCRNPNEQRCASDGKCKRTCENDKNSLLELVDSDGKTWLFPTNLSDLMNILSTRVEQSEYMLVGGNTAHGVYRRSESIRVFIDIKSIAILHTTSLDDALLIVGANISIAELMETLLKAAAKYEQYAYALHLVKHLDLVATVPVRNAGTIAGNLSIKHAHNEFQSDIFLLLETIGAKLNIVSTDGLISSYTPLEYLALDMHEKVILNVVFPQLESDRYEFRSYKIMIRAQNAHAMVNAGFLFEFQKIGVKHSVQSCRICYGGINPKFVHAEATEKLLTGVNDFYTNQTLQNAIKSLQNEINPDERPPEPPADYRKQLAIALFYRFVLATTPPERIKDPYVSGRIGLERPLSSGSQTFQSNGKLYPLTQPALKYEGLIQCAGEAEYINDKFSSTGPADNEVWTAFVPATQVHAKIVRIDATKALEIPGVVAFFSAKDIPGENSFVVVTPRFLEISQSEMIFVELDTEVAFYGQPCGVIVAKTMALANLAAAHVEIMYEQMQQQRSPIIPSIYDWIEADEREVFRAANEQNRLPPNQSAPFFEFGRHRRFKGNLTIGSQYHFSMEPQTAFCVPNEDGGIIVSSATQWFDHVHAAISKSLNIPQNKIIGTHKRLGGSYGGKLTRAGQIACACALVCHLTRRPVRFVMNIESNMSTIGKRVANSIDYQATVHEHTGRVTKFDAKFTQDFGCSLNDDTSQQMVLCLLHTCYARTSDWQINVVRAKTDSPSTTWKRAPGTIEGIAAIENLMEHIAREVNLDPAQVRLNNLNRKQQLYKIFPEFLKDTEYYERKAEISVFNRKNRWKKRGIAVSVMRYPIHYIASFAVYVAIYKEDGTVVVSHGGCEMGQGVNTKVAQVVAFMFDIPLSTVSVAPFDSIVMANRSMAAASIASDSVCLAARNACKKILDRLKPIRKRIPQATWPEIVQLAWANNIDLTQKELLPQTEPKPYDIIGCACAEIELDVLTGNLQILRVDISEDVGNSVSPLVDVGQIEGSFVMGIGYWLTEKLIYNEMGELLTNRTWNYKVPGAKDIPIDFRVKFIQNARNDSNVGIFGSKATGEPAITLSVVVVFALRHALDSVRLDNGLTEKWYHLGSANTPDVVFKAANVDVNDFKLN